MEGSPSPFTVTSPNVFWRYTALTILCLTIGLLIVSAILLQVNRPPADFPVATAINIEAGESVARIVEIFADAGVVRSKLFLYTVLMTQYTPSDIKASTYVFDQPYTTLGIAAKLASGDFTSNLIRLTHREGERVTELAPAVHSALPNISPEEFTELALPFEGYLWPETYFFPPHYTADDVVTKMRADYEEFILPRRAKIAARGLSEAEVVILASIIEREANSEDSMKMVSGILQNRLAIDMPLQADASIEYELDKPLGSLTAADLKIDSPYNTYTNKGLPPTPIGNPGAMAIDAVLEPTASEYLFYITGDDGNFYYAETFDEHRANIEKYLQ